jgi:arsenite methyltransferase
MSKTSIPLSASTACCGPDCCGGDSKTATAPAIATAHTGTAAVTEMVREKYGSTARSGLSSNDAGVRGVAEAFGYSADELTSIPAEANMGLSCGNPTATANLRAGEVVVDLGSGGGLDVFLAAKKVGPTGKAIGIDMTPDMIELSRRNATKSGLTNVEFHLAGIDALPLPDASVDVVISNCVINLAADKAAVLSEIARVLKPGGRVGVSDVVADDRLSAEERAERGSFSGCIAGALSFSEYRTGLAAVGLTDVSIEPTHAVADGLHGAIVKATKPLEPTALDDRPAMPVLPRAIAMFEAGGDGCGCGTGGCC